MEAQTAENRPANRRKSGRAIVSDDMQAAGMPHRFKPGQSGNPLGRPKQEDIRALARKGTKRAVSRLMELIESPDEKIALAACNSLIDRAYGPPRAPEDDEQAHKGAVNIQVVRLSDARENAEDAQTVEVRRLTGTDEGMKGIDDE